MADHRHNGFLYHPAGRTDEMAQAQYFFGMIPIWKVCIVSTYRK